MAGRFGPEADFPERQLSAINGRPKCAEELPQKQTLNRGAPPYHRRRYFPQ
jgi:hypothetical protein